MKNKLFWSCSFLKPFFPVLFFLLCFTLAGNYASTFEPLFTGKIIDALTLKDRAAFFVFLKIIILFQIVGLGFSLLSSWFQFLLQRKITIYTESRLYLNLLYLPPKGIAEKDSGKLLNLFLSDLGVMTGIYTSQIPSILTSIIMMCIIGLRLFKIDFFIFCLTLIVSIIPVFLAKYFGAKQAIINEAQRKKQDEYTSYINETINGLQEIKNHSSQKFFIYKFKNILKFIFVHVKKSTIIGMQSSSVSFFVNFTINISLFAIVGLTVLEGKNTVGTITAALMYSQKFRSLVSSCAETYKEIIISFVSVERIKNLFDERKNKSTFVKEESNFLLAKKIKIENLSFAYKNKKIIFQNLATEFSFPGLYLIKGENGAGKTTLFNIITGNVGGEDNNLSGKIIFKNLSSKISFVRQTPFVFTGTIKENLCFGQEKNEKDILAALTKTKLDIVIEKLPEGINTKLGGENHILSKGQIQRLALSRCLLQNAEVILFDEVENALDAETNKALFELLKDLKLKKLILMISHKNDYDNIADGIFIVKKA